MPGTRRGLAVLILLLLSAPAHAQTLDALEGKFAFNWHTNPDREKCVRVTGPLLAGFKSKTYRCDPNARTNTSSGAKVRTCTATKGRKEYLIFDSMRACEDERKDQAAAE
jgi:hypothetical protein